jgi:hypothetical protein
MWALRADNARGPAAPACRYLVLDQSGGEEAPAVVHANSETSARRAYLAWRDGGRLPAGATVTPGFGTGPFVAMVVVRTPRPA